MEEHLIKMWEKFMSYQYNFLNEVSILIYFCGISKDNNKNITTIATHFCPPCNNMTSVIYLHLHNMKVLGRFLFKVPGKFLIFRTFICLFLDM